MQPPAELVSNPTPSSASVKDVLPDDGAFQGAPFSSLLTLELGQVLLGFRRA